MDRGSQYVLHLANLTGGTFPSAQTVDFVGNTSHQDFAMISANVSLNWLFVNDYNTRYPDIVPYNPGDKRRATPVPTPKAKAYATHGNTVLATALLSGSILTVVIFFSMLPFLCRENYIDTTVDEKVALLHQSVLQGGRLTLLSQRDIVKAPMSYPPSFVK